MTGVYVQMEGGHGTDDTQVAAKLKSVTEFTIASQNKDPTNLRFNFLSAQGQQAVMIAGGNIFRTIGLACDIKCVSDHVNRNVFETMSKNWGPNWGSIMMDFPTEQLIDTIVKSNFADTATKSGLKMQMKFSDCSDLKNRELEYLDRQKDVKCETSSTGALNAFSLLPPDSNGCDKNAMRYMYMCTEESTFDTSIIAAPDHHTRVFTLLLRQRNN